jgi:transposase
LQVLHEEGLHSFKKVTSPAVSEKQEELQRVRIGRLYRHILDGNLKSPSIVMDDESYFELSGHNMPGNDHYYATSSGAATSSHKFAPKVKFPEKLLVWIAISDLGISRPYFAPSRGAMNAQIYKTKCIEQRLKPFLDIYHGDGNYLFWPDLASCHYAKETLHVFEELDVNYVSREMNPPNCPQLRPIEQFWGWLKQLVYDKGWTASSVDQLKRRVKYCTTKLDMTTVRHMMAHVKSDIRKARAHGPISLLH